MSALPRVRLSERLEAALMLGHPWVYRDQVGPGCSAPPGSFVRVQCGRFEGFALWDPESPIALRLYSRERCPDAAWFGARVRDAWSLRAPLLAEKTNAFRWIYGEADGLPGVVVDHYAGTAVIVCDTPAVRGVVDALLPHLQEVAALRTIVLRKRNTSAEERLELLWGAEPPRHSVVEENGLRLLVNLSAGQKTGLFLDHRENRATIERLARGHQVLNLFAYSGAFSLAALRGGAQRVVSVDVAAEAAQDAAENLRLNGMDPARHHFEVADVFDYLKHERSRGTRFDLVICDPPTFARNKSHLDKALKAYARVNAGGLELTGPGALYAAASCTGRVTPAAFKLTLAESASRARRRLQVVHEAGQALDHPELVSHPESRYLKFVVARALARA